MPDGGSELGAPVRCEDCWHAKAGDPALEEVLRAVGGQHGTEEDCLHQPSGGVNDGEEEGVTTEGQGGPDQVHTDVADSAGRHLNGGWAARARGGAP